MTPNDSAALSALAALALNLASRPQEETCGWTLNFHEPRLNHRPEVAGGLLLDPFNAGPRILGLPGGFVVVFSVFVVWFVVGSLSILKVPERRAR